MGDKGENMASAEGTYACPICGCATPHAHSDEQIAEWRKEEIVENRNNIDWDDVCTDQFRRIKASIHRLFPIIPTVGTVANLVEDAEKLIMADRELLSSVAAEERIPEDYAGRYYRLRAIVNKVLRNKGFGPESE
jgi:DNA repair exonuclease SbcCD ATPase subunit